MEVLRLLQSANGTAANGRESESTILRSVWLSRRIIGYKRV